LLSCVLALNSWLAKFWLVLRRPFLGLIGWLVLAGWLLVLPLQWLFGLCPQNAAKLCPQPSHVT
jgi:hypothetical protein